MRQWATIVICFCAPFSAAQDYPRKDVDLSRLADELFAFQDLDLNYEDLYENMMQLLSNPINLNKAGAEELRFLNILSELQIENFLRFRNENGNLLTVYELQAVPGFDLQTLHRLIPFVQVANNTSSLDGSLLKRILTEENNYFLMRYERTVETKAGFSPETNSKSKFKGSPDKLYLRFRTSRPGDFSVGFTAEKDAGEQFTFNPSSGQYGFDYISFHAQVQNKGRLKNMIVGDYQSQFGQGLMLGGIFGMGKGGETILTTRRSNIGLLPYTSLREAGLLRGAAATYEITRNIFITGFYSHSKRDAVLGTTETDETFTSSFQQTGLHRNENELNGRKKIAETNYGAVINYRFGRIDAGVMFNAVDFSVPLNRSPSNYNQFAWQGNQNKNMGAFLNYSFHNISFFSEVSKTLNGSMGSVVGIIGSLSDKLDFSLLFRKFDKNFYTFYSNAFSENTVPQNESGIYWGWKYRWNRKYALAGYADLFQFPWLRYRSFAPSHGYEWLVRWSYQPSKKVLIFLQAREESKLKNLLSNSTLYPTSQGIKRNYWINCDYGISQKLKMKTRAQFSTYQLNHLTTKGVALMQDLSIDLGKVAFTARHTLFDTDDYDNRQYVYEQDVWLAYSLPAYYGKGVRDFVQIEYKANHHLSLWLRYAHTRYTDREEIGSGVDAIAGNTRNDVKFQLRIRL